MGVLQRFATVRNAVLLLAIDRFQIEARLACREGGRQSVLQIRYKFSRLALNRSAGSLNRVR